MGVRSSIFTEHPDGVPPTNPKRLARVAGLLYLAVAITGGFSEGYLGPFLYVRGDAAATAGNLAANPGLVRLGAVAHLADAVFFVSRLPPAPLRRDVLRAAVLSTVTCAPLLSGPRGRRWPGVPRPD